MRISDDGYIADFKDINKILENFMNYTVGDLTSVTSPELKVSEYADNIVRKLGNIKLADSSTDYTEALRISDLLCLMKYFENHEKDFEDILLSYMKNLSSNIRSAVKLPWVELFLAISLQRLTQFFTLECTDIEYSKIYRQVSMQLQNCKTFEMTDRTTLKAILESISGYMFLSWNPCYDINDYTDKIKACCRIIKLILVDGIAAWYYDRFNFSELSKNINGKIELFSKPIDIKDNDDYTIQN